MACGPQVGVAGLLLALPQLRLLTVVAAEDGGCDSSCTSCDDCFGGTAVCTCTENCDDGTNPQCHDSVVGPQAVTTRENFASQYFLVTANNVTSRVQLEIMDQDVQIALDPFGRGDDLFVNVLGFAKNQAPLHAASAQYYALVNRENLPGDAAPPGYATLVLEWRLDGQADFLAPYALNSDGNPQFLKFYIPASNHRYSAKGLMDAMNSSMRGEHALQALTYTNVPWANALPVVNFLAASNHDGGDAEVGIMIQSALTDVAAWRFPATYGAGAQTISAPLQNVTAPVSSLLPTNLSRFLETRVTTAAWVENTNAARQVVTGLNPATVDRVHSLQIACPGLAAGVHVNGRGGSSTLCRFPVNTDRTPGSRHVPPIP